jgi:hypothetical protein
VAKPAAAPSIRLRRFMAVIAVPVFLNVPWQIISAVTAGCKSGWPAAARPRFDCENPQSGPESIVGQARRGAGYAVLKQ